MTFMNAMENEFNNEKQLTENGAVGWKTTGKKLVDLNFAVSSLRQKTEKEIANKFIDAFYENKMLAMKWLFYVADIREGLGERRTFRVIMKYLAENHSDIAIAVLRLIPEYNRWDSVVALLDCNNADVCNEVLAVIKEQLACDVANMKKQKPISLIAKWLPSVNTSSKQTREYARIICHYLGWKEATYRKTLVALRKYLDVVECKMSAKEWSEINYSTVPSNANVKYSKAFMRNDEERRKAYLESLVKGETKINAGVLFPHDIVNKYIRHKYDESFEQMWKALPNLSVENCLVVRDGSGSMQWNTISANSKCTPLDVATALAIYLSEHNSGEWKDKFITFSSNPKFVDLSGCTNLKDKLVKTYHEDDCTNTDIYKVMKLILNTAINHNLTQKDMPKSVVILSDMQFNGRCHNMNMALFDEISNEYKSYGLLMPKIIFWNLNNRNNNTIPMRTNDLGLILCSGFSIQLLNMFMSNKLDPYDILVETLNGERYNAIEEALRDIV